MILGLDLSVILMGLLRIPNLTDILRGLSLFHQFFSASHPFSLREVRFAEAFTQKIPWRNVITEGLCEMFV